MYNYMLPSDIYYYSKGFISNAKFPLGKYMLWLVGVKENISEEMENIFVFNEHTLLLEDSELKKKYEEYLDINLIPDKYKTGRTYYEGSKNIQEKRYAYPAELPDSHILKKDNELAKKVKNMLTVEASPSLAEPELLRLLPKAYIIVFEWDMLKDQILIYSERLRANGVPVEVAYYENAYHGMVPFIDEHSGYELSRIIFNDLVKYINDNI